MSPRVACVDVPALPLQLLSRAHPQWADAPLAVVEEDSPQAKILWVDELAAARRVRVGMRYASALQLSRALRAAPVSEESLRRARAEILEALHARTPRVEPDRERAGVFWLDPSGLDALFGPLEAWAKSVHSSLTALELDSSVVVGFARLRAWAIARSMSGSAPDGHRVLESVAEETHLASRTPLLRLDLEPELREALLGLGVRTLGGFLQLPRGDVGLRFGPEASRLHALFDDALRLPMQAAPFEEPIAIEAELNPPDGDATRLLFCIKGALHALIAELTRRALALRALRIVFELERGGAPEERIEPARATRDAMAILELVRLRLDRIRLTAPVERLRLSAEPVRLDGEQLSLFAGERRDPAAASLSIARLRAAFGEGVVTRARLRDAWLPENRFVWEPTSKVDAPLPITHQSKTEGVLVRRLLSRPERLPVDARGRPRTRPPLVQLTGPYRIQGGWWIREAARDYFFGEREDGALLWLFRERRERTWFLHGVVD